MSMEGRLAGPNRNEQQAPECAVHTSVHRWIGAVAGAAAAAVADDDDADGSWNVQLYCRSRRVSTFVFTFNTRGEKKEERNIRRDRDIRFNRLCVVLFRNER